MSYSVHRIRQLACLGCGHEQRGKIRVEPEILAKTGEIVSGTEVMPECHSCGRSDLWVDPIDTMRVIAEHQREVAEQCARDQEAAYEDWLRQVFKGSGVIFPGFFTDDDDEEPDG